MRYTVGGGVAFLSDIGTLFLLTEYVGLNYLISAGIAFIFGLTVSYLSSIWWVFDIRKIKNQKIEFMYFLFIGLVGIVLNEFIIWLLTDILLIYYLISKIFTTIIILPYNFFVKKIILFSK